MRERLVQQQQQTQAALAQVHLVRDQLQAETAARLEAQARTHQLLLHNRELLDHVQVLVSELQSMEERDAAASAVRDKVRPATAVSAAGTSLGSDVRYAAKASHVRTERSDTPQRRFHVI